MYYMNNTTLVDLEYPRPFHNVIIMLIQHLEELTFIHCMHINKYFKYMLGDLKYMGDEMFMTCHIGKRKLTLFANVDAIMTYNKMHAR
jgi:hypothetical protein